MSSIAKNRRHGLFLLNKWQHDRNGSANPYLGLESYCSAMRVNSLLDNRQSEARAGNIFDILAPVESFKQVLAVLLRDADACVLDAQRRLIIGTLKVEPNVAAFRRVLNGV